MQLLASGILSSVRCATTDKRTHAAANACRWAIEAQNVMDIHRTFKVTLIIIFIPQSAQTGCGVNPSSCSMGNGTSLLGCEAAGAWKGPSLPSSAEVRSKGSYASNPPQYLYCAYRNKCTFIFTLIWRLQSLKAWLKSIIVLLGTP